MKRNRLGFFSASAMIALALTLLAAGAVAALSGSAMFSPGGLSDMRGDQPLNGAVSHLAIGDDCAACHVAPWGADTMSERCRDCHRGITSEIADETSLHGALFRYNPGLECRDCHPDHRGADAPLTEMVAVSFPHDTVGFSLASHQDRSDGTGFDCVDCHTRSIASLDQSTCTECHRELASGFMEAHTAAFGDDCLACHDGLESYGADFDHGGTEFALTGGHAAATCPACHPDARTLADLQSTAGDCAACHLADDAHDGDLGTDCAACHTTDGWVPSSFDHDSAAFGLEGAHVAVDCAACHVDRVFGGTPTDCYSCHQQDDEHDGRYGTDCSLCHTAAAWEPAQVDHASISAPCVSCHLADDPHEGRFGADCGACHSTEAWTPASFDHDLSDFPLTGAHADLECTLCHTGEGYGGLSTDCAACHADPAFHQGAVGTDCASCHNTSAWVPAGYGLSHPYITDEGGSGINHGGASCRTCHPSTVYGYTCLSCHSDNQGGEGGEDDD